MTPQITAIADHVTRPSLPTGEDPAKMPAPPRAPNDDARETARRLIDLIQVLLPERPGVVVALERCVLALVIEEMRQRIIERLQKMSPEDIQHVDVLTASLVARPPDDPAA